MTIPTWLVMTVAMICIGCAIDAFINAVGRCPVFVETRHRYLIAVVPNDAVVVVVFVIDDAVVGVVIVVSLVVLLFEITNSIALKYRRRVNFIVKGSLLLLLWFLLML